jgi:hypothetical protein
LCVLSNAISSQQVLTGVVDASDANVSLGGYGFTANPNQYLRLLPSLPTSIDLAFTDKKYKFPQVWRKLQSLLDQRTPFGFRYR